MSGQQLRTTVALGAGMSQEGVVASLEAGDALRAGGVVSAEVSSLGVLDALGDEALVVVCADEADEVVAFLEAVVIARPLRPVVVAFAGHPNGFTRRAFEAGIDDLVVVDAEDGEIGPRVAFALEKAMTRRDLAPVSAPGPAAEVEEPGEVLTVLGPKGGTGKTTVSANLSAALARAGKRVIAVDLDLQFGDLGLALGLTPQRTIFDLATAGGAIDAEKLDAYLTTSESGVRVLMAPVRPDQADAVSVDFVRSLLTALRTMADVVVVDTRPGFTPEVIAAIDAASSLCLVGALDAPALKNTRLAINALELMGVDAEKLRLVLNRSDMKAGVTVRDATAVLGRAPDVLVPADRSVVMMVNQGRPAVLARSSDAGKALGALAELFTSVEEPAEARRSPRFVRRRETEDGEAEPRRSGRFVRRGRQADEAEPVVAAVEPDPELVGVAAAPAPQPVAAVPPPQQPVAVAPAPQPVAVAPTPAPMPAMPEQHVAVWMPTQPNGGQPSFGQVVYVPQAALAGPQDVPSWLMSAPPVAVQERSRRRLRRRAGA